MLNSNEKLKAFRDLEQIFRLEKLEDLQLMKSRLQSIADKLHAEANKIPRNSCTPSGGMCACSGACIKPEAKALHDAGYELDYVIIDLFK